jgi:hypothetical protein
VTVGEQQQEGGMASESRSGRRGETQPDDEWIDDRDTRGVVILPEPDLVPPEALPPKAEGRPTAPDSTPP